MTQQEKDKLIIEALELLSSLIYTAIKGVDNIDNSMSTSDYTEINHLDGIISDLKNGLTDKI
jgi:hypothetical protein